jgi:selenocysteine-specific elongation factor
LRCYTDRMNANTSPGTRRTFVVGTAGHVDHGKSTLVRRLTGIDPDRLQEEKAREMTIDLGFAWLNLPGDISVSVIDVPGHERFIKNMLAGVGGLDAALVVVAADEGPMPQTIEHLAILDLLDITSGIVVVTKSDLVDTDWLDLVVEETREVLSGTALEAAEIIPVSAHTGAGTDTLLQSLARLLAESEPHGRSGKARMPVDRVFSIAGFGTVVTGTLLGNQVSVGDELEILPARLRARVRGLQSHNEQVSTALPGSRTAINLTGIDKDSVQRGDVISAPGWLRPTKMIDAKLRLVAGAPHALSQNDPVDIFVGAAESPAHVTLLDADQILPGSEGWVQIRLESDLVVVEGDQFIVRQASPSITIGGGKVLNAHPRRHRRFRDDVIQELETRETGSPNERVLQALADGPVSVNTVCETLDTGIVELRLIVGELIESDDVTVLGGESGSEITPAVFLARTSAVRELGTSISNMLAEFHRVYPMRTGMPREDVRRRAGLSNRVFDALVDHLASRQGILDSGNVLANQDFEVRLNDEQQRRADSYLAALRQNPIAPPAAASFNVDAELLGALAAKGLVVRMADNVVYDADVLAGITRETLQLLNEQGELTLAEFRDHFGCSRKYAQAVLEYFDQQRITRRIGDVRVRGSG